MLSLAASVFFVPRKVARNFHTRATTSSNALTLSFNLMQADVAMTTRPLVLSPYWHFLVGRSPLQMGLRCTSCGNPEEGCVG